ncbi:MAG: hypothetical protein J6Y36_00010 [Treponema sp.]|nr:hypothetical protein [Treponema sp.]
MKKIFLLLILLVCYSSLYSVNPGSPLKIAEDLFNNSQYDEALEIVNRELQKDDFNIEARFIRGCILQVLSENTKALEDVNIVLTYEPSNLEARYLRATIYSNIEDFENALKDLNFILSISPDETLALSLRGCLNSELGNYGEALIDLNNAIKNTYPNDPEICKYYYNRAKIYYDMESYKLSLKDVEAALSYNYTDYKSLILKALLLNILSETGKAIDTINYALVIYPAAYELYLYRILFYLDSKKLDMAKNELDNLERSIKKSPNYHFLMAKYYASLGDKKNAIKELELCKKAKKDNDEDMLFDVKITIENGINTSLDDFNTSDLH